VPLVPLPWNRIVGGRAAFERSYGLIAQEAARRQMRLTAALDAFGPPGEAEWDPMIGEIQLRGQLFRAQQLGSYDGESWLWSWANLGLLIPEEHTSCARAARDSAVKLGVHAFSAPGVIESDERIAPLMGGLACAHGFGEAFWISNDYQVFVFMPGQLDLSAQVRLATIYCAEKRTMRELLVHLRGVRELAQVPFELIEREDVMCVRGAGFEIRIRRIEKLKDVIKESKSMPPGEGAPRATAMVITVESELSQGYADTGFGTLAGRWVPTKMASRAEIPWQALAIVERLNQLTDVGLYDSYLRVWYPRFVTDRGSQ
jgi:hypothetical protein